MQADSSSLKGTDPDIWRPRKRLRHLHSVKLRWKENQHQNSDQACFFVLWSHIKVADSGETEASCLHISKQIRLARNEEWAPLDLKHLDVAPQLLDGVASGTVHLHFYTLPAEKILSKDLQDVSKWTHPSIASQKAKLSPLHDSAGSQASSEAEEGDLPGSDACSDSLEKPFQKLEDLPDTEDQAANGISHQMGQDAAHFIGLPQQKSSLRSRQEPETYQLSCSGQCGSLLADSGEVHDTSFCDQLEAPGHLLLAVSLDLATLQNIGTDLQLLDRSEAALQLVFELTDGCFLVWPSLLKTSSSKDLTEIAEKKEFGTPEQADANRRRWSLFKRSTFGSTTDLMEKEAEGNLSLEDVRNASLPSLTGPPSSMLSPTPSLAVSGDRDSNTAEASLEDILSSIDQLKELQEKLESAKAGSAQSLRRLSQVLMKREGLMKEQQCIRDCRAKAKATKQREEAVRKRVRGVNASSKAARDLMIRQTSSVSAAASKLEDLHIHLDGPANAYLQASQMDWQQLHRKLVARRCRLVADLQSLYDIQPKTVSVVQPPESGFLWNQLDDGWGKVSVTARRQPPPKAATEALKAALEKHAEQNGPPSGSEESVGGDSGSEMSQALTELSLAGSQTREIARLAIGSLSLEPYLDRQNSDTLHVIGQQSDKEKDLKLAAALGYAAHVTHHLAQYLGVPLKYPIKPSNSHSVITTAAQPLVTATWGRDPSANENDPSASQPPGEYILHPEGSEQSHCSYAIFLLNKDIEQLLECHGLTSAGPSLVLQNLYKLLTAALSAVVPRQDWLSHSK